MAKENINQRVKRAGSGVRERDLQAVLTAVQEDLATLRTKVNALAAKLDADVGVTDINYVATCGVPVLNLQA